MVTDYKKELVSLGYTQAEADAYLAFIKERTAYWTQQEKEKGKPQQGQQQQNAKPRKVK